jgi:hypothetical protein
MLDRGEIRPQSAQKILRQKLQKKKKRIVLDDLMKIQIHNATVLYQVRVLLSQTLLAM